MFNSDILRAAPTKQVGGFSISFLQCVLVISGICRFWVSTHWLLHVIRYGNKKVARVQLRAAIQKQEKGPGTPLLESLSGFPHQDPSGVFVSFLSAFKASSCTLAKTDSRRYSVTVGPPAGRWGSRFRADFHSITVIFQGSGWWVCCCWHGWASVCLGLIKSEIRRVQVEPHHVILPVLAGPELLWAAFNQALVHILPLGQDLE